MGVFLFVFFKDVFIGVRVQVSGRGKGERLSDSPMNAEPEEGLNLTTMTSRTEP